MNAQSFFPLVCGGLVLAALVLTSCGGGGPAPAPTAVTATLPSTPTPVPYTPPPEPTWASLQDADALWQQIAASATLMKPILRPTYLPPDLTQVRLWATGWGGFVIEYEDVAREKRVGMAAGAIGNTHLCGARCQQQQVVVRNMQALYQVDDVEDPLSDAELLWEEPGKLDQPADLNVPNGERVTLDRVDYYIVARGFSKDDLIKVADSLQPVE